MGKVVALVDDMIFQMKLAETARQLGVELKFAANGEVLLASLSSGPGLVIVDLNAKGKPVEAVKRLRAAGNAVRVVGFLSHVQTELSERARAAGCDEVLPRSSFTQNLAAILATAKD